MADELDNDLDFPDDEPGIMGEDLPEAAPDPADEPEDAAVEGQADGGDDEDEDDDPALKSKRVKRRIDQLTWQREEERRQRVQVEAELAALKQQLGSRQARDQASELDAKRREILREIKRMDDEFEDDEDKRLALQDQLTDINLDLAGIRRQQPRLLAQPTARQAEDPAVAVAAQWMGKNPEYSRNPQFKQAVDALYDQLVAEGYNPAHQRIFTELDSRLKQPRRSGSPVAPPARGGESGGKPAFTNGDMAAMKAAGMDPYDPKQRAKYIRSQRELG